MASSFSRSILLTGGAGFIGSNVAVHLVTSYPTYQIVILDKLDYCGSIKNLQEVWSAPNFKFIKGDILSGDLVTYILRTEKIDTILHFAAQTHVDNSFGNSISFTLNNILGTHVLLEAAREFSHQIKRFIHVSTDEVYGEIPIGKAHETATLDPTNPYSATKGGAEFLVKAYHKSWNLPMIITRGNNVYGPKQFPEKIIPKFIGLLERSKPCYIHGDGSPTRNYIYVSDVVSAFDIILHKGSIGETYNIGTRIEISNLQVAEKLLEIYGLSAKASDYIQYVENRRWNDCRYSIDTAKLEALGWSCKVTFDTGLRKTIEWYKENFHNWDMSESALVPHPHPPPTNSLNYSQHNFPKT